MNRHMGSAVRVLEKEMCSVEILKNMSNSVLFNLEKKLIGN
jgi:hypothetical protein